MAKNDGGPASKVTTPKEEGLKPCEHCGKQPVKFGLADAYRCEPCMKNQGWMSRRDWNRRSQSAPQGKRDWKADDVVGIVSHRISERAAIYPGEVLFFADLKPEVQAAFSGGRDDRWRTGEKKS